MKQVLFTSILALAGSIAAFAADAPKELYLVGSFNNWTVPADGGTEYALTDPDGDMTYTGSFDLSQAPDYLQFKVFLSADASWDNSADYLGLVDDMGIALYKDETRNVQIATNHANGNSDIKITNWVPGELEVSVKLSEVNGYFQGTMSLSASNQPEKPEFPETVYVIGNFNDWKLPDNGNLNGAKALKKEMSGNGNISYQGDDVYPEGNLEMLFYYIDPATAKNVFVGTVWSPFYLKKYDENRIANYWIYTANTENIEEEHISIKKWNGSNISIKFKPEADYAEFTSENAPMNEMPSSLYVVWEENGVRKISDEPMYYFRSPYGNITSFFLTDVNSTDPTEDHIWGTPEKTTVAYGSLGVYYDIVKGGYPLELKEEGAFSFACSIVLSGECISLNIIPGVEYSDLEEIFVIGYMNDWAEPAEKNASKFKDLTLKKIDEGVFRGNISFPANNNAEFRFVTELVGWNREYSIGSGLQDFSNNPVYYPGQDTFSMYQKGLSNWHLIDWVEDQTLTVTVDIPNNLFTLSKIDSGIEEISGDEKVLWFDLTGTPVKNPANGLFIKVRNGKAQKVIVK